MSREDVRALVRSTRATQGLPPAITDAATLARITSMIGAEK